MNKTKAFFQKHKYFFLIFSFLLLYHFLVVNRAQWFTVDEANYSFYCVDYSMGFCDKILPGDLYNLFVGIYTKEAVSAYLAVMYALFFLMIAYLLEKFILKFQDNQKASLVFIAFLLAAPFSLNIFITSFGMFDFNFAFFFLLALLCLQNKYLKFAVPLFAAMMVLVHYAAVICYIPALLLIVFLYFIKAETKKKKTAFALIFVISLVVSGSLCVFFLSSGSKYMVYSHEEFSKILAEQRHATSYYFDYAIYKEAPLELPEEYKDYYDIILSENQSNIFALILQQLKLSLTMINVKDMVVVDITGYFFEGFLIAVLGSYLKEKKNVLKRLLVVAMIALSLGIPLVGVLLSSDYARWMSHSYMLLFAQLLYLIYLDFDIGIEKIQTFFSKLGYSFVYMILLILFGTAIIPYTFSVRDVIEWEAGTSVIQ